MRRKPYKLHEFRGQRMTVLQISEITGISVPTLRRRANRGLSFEMPLRQVRRIKPCDPRLRLTGDRDRDLKAIISARHRDLIRKHQQVAKAGRCEMCA